MGSACAFHLYDAQVDAVAAAEAEVRRIEHRFSRYRPDSVLARINRAAATGSSLVVDEESAGLLDYAFACHRASGGLFDITTGILRRAWDFSSGVPPSQEMIDRWLPLVGLEKIRWDRPCLSFPLAGVELDFGGIGKEYAADRAATICTEAGMVHGLIDLGGDIRAIGPPPDAEAWVIQIRDPQTPDRAFARVPLANGGLATSGDYERCIMHDGRRLGHILNPITGWPAQGLASVSVMAATCLLAGTVASLAMLKGRAGAAWLVERGLPAVWAESAGGSGRVSQTFQLA